MFKVPLNTTLYIKVGITTDLNQNWLVMAFPQQSTHFAMCGSNLTSTSCRSLNALSSHSTTHPLCPSEVVRTLCTLAPSS